MFAEKKRISVLEYVYQYKDHLGNVRLSYTDDGNYESILNSDFVNDFDGWLQNGSVNYSLEDGRIKVNVNTSFEGIKHNLNGFTTTAGEVLKVKITFDKGNTQSNVRLYLQELDSNGSLVSYNLKDGNLLTGTHEYSHTMANTGNSIIFRIDKTNTNTSSNTYFYVDHVSLSKGKLEILEENNFYPFGLEHKGYNNVISGAEHPYGFNGKEEQKEMGINWLDYGWRNYDASLGRWMNVDPLAEQMRRHSPYNYAFDNPISFIDPDGMAPLWINNGDGTFTAQAGDSAATLAEDAGISLDRANEIVEGQLGENYVGEDGELKSDVEVGDVVDIPETDNLTDEEFNSSFLNGRSQEELKVEVVDIDGDGILDGGVTEGDTTFLNFRGKSNFFSKTVTPDKVSTTVANQILKKIIGKIGGSMFTPASVDTYEDQRIERTRLGLPANATQRELDSARIVDFIKKYKGSSTPIND